MPSSSLVRLVGLGAAAAFLACAGPALAQDTQAEGIFEEGLRLYDAGDYAAACPKLKSAVKLSTSEPIGGKLLLAECYEKQGKWASAWAIYRELIPKAELAGQPARRDKAEAGRIRVEPKLARLKIDLAAAVAAIPELSIDRDGEAVPREAWDVALPVDPGTVAVTARAPGKRPFTASLRIDDAPTTSTVRIDRLDEDAAVPPDAPAAAPSPVEGQVGSSEPSAAGGGGGLTGLGIAGIAVGAAGIVTMGISAGIAAGAKSSWDDAVAARSDGGVADARGTGNAATGVFIAGAALAALGTTLLIVDVASPGSPNGASRAAGRDGWRLRTAGLGALAEGSF